MRKINRLMERILTIVPDAKCTIYDDDYDSIIWAADNADAKPSYAACNSVTVEQVKAAKETQDRSSLKEKILNNADGVDMLILKAMYKDLKARDVVTTVDEFVAYLAD